MSILFYLLITLSILIIGIICSAFAAKFRIPQTIVLLVSGFLLYKLLGSNSLLSPSFLSGISIISLAIILFEITSKFQIKNFDSLSIRVLRFVFISTFLNITILSSVFLLIYLPQSNLLFPSIIASLIFSILISASAFSYSFAHLKGFNLGVIRILEMESSLIALFSAVFPFLLIEFFYNIQSIRIISFSFGPLLSFAMQIAIGLGVGVFIGLIMFKLLNKISNKLIRHIFWLVASILAYAISESVNGFGLLAVISLGFIFGHFSIKREHHLDSIDSLSHNIIQYFVFILLGFCINIPISFFFILSAFLLFIFYLLLRYLSSEIAFKQIYTFKEKLFITLNVSKGPLTASIILLLSTAGITFIDTLLPLLLVFIILGIVTSQVASNHLKNIKTY